MDNTDLGLAAQMACLLEVTAPKPGNVNRDHDFNDTCFEDFVISASAIGPVFKDSDKFLVGEIILKAVRATRRFVQTNTNLGIIIMLAPLAKAAGMGGDKSLQTRVKQVLKELTIDDARLAYEAIRLANPGGMGQTDKGDIDEQEVDMTLAQAMFLARDRDALAREYVTGYAITFDLGLPALKIALAKKANFSQAIVQAFLFILSKVPDTLIARKSGWEQAKIISSMAGQVLENGGVFTNKEGIQKFDNYLRDPGHRLNPGTTADLVAGVLFAYMIEKKLSFFFKGH